MNEYNKRGSDFSAVLKLALDKYREEFHKQENLRRQELKKERRHGDL